MAALAVRRGRTVPDVSGIADFGALYYTDCRPGQGTRGSAGFQFQAVSPGIGQEGMSIVAATALYEAPQAWMRDQRPVADYPASLAHIAEDGLFATAAGVYLGKEANGNREGNQFTHAIVTRDARSYQLVRPAQLWAAPWWATAPADGTEIDPVPAHPATGPLETESVRDRVAAAPDAKPRLVALLSAVHRLRDPDARQTVVLIGADPEEAACWIAAATLLLPATEALRTSFKIYSADPSYSRHDIIGLHPEFAGRWRDTATGTGHVVFDLDRGRNTPVEPMEEADFWVRRFLSGDAYDVVDAVELAGQLAADPARPSRADRIVAACVQLREPLTEPELVRMAAQWLSTASERAVEIARDILVDAALGAGPDADVLRTLADVAGSRGWSLYATVRQGLLLAELTELDGMRDPVAAVATVRARPPLLQLGMSARAEDEDRAVMERAIGGAPPERMPVLLALARRHRVKLAVERMTDIGQRFARWWVGQDDERLAPDRWDPPAYVFDWVRAVLRSALASPDPDAVRRATEAVRRRWWRPFVRDAASLRDPLDREVLRTAAAGSMSLGERTRLIRRVFEIVRADPPDRVPPDELAWQVLFGREPSFGEAEQFSDMAAEVGIPMSAEVAGRLVAQLDRLAPGDRRGADLAERIEDAGFRLSAEQESRAKWQAEVRKLAELIMVSGAQAPSGQDLAKLVDGVPAKLLDVYVSIIVDAVVAAEDRARAVEVIVHSSPPSAKLLYSELRRQWPNPPAPLNERQAAAAAFAFVLCNATPLYEDQQRDFPYLLRMLGMVVAPLGKKDRAAIERAGRLGDPWMDWLAEVEPKRWGVLPRRHRHSGAKDR